METSAAASKEKGNEYYRQKRYEEALRCYLEAVQIDPLYADAWYNLGMTCRALGYLDESVTCFERARKFSGGNNIAYPLLSLGPPQSTRSEGPYTRQNVPGPGPTRTKRQDPAGKKKQSVKRTAFGIVFILVLAITIAAVLPVMNGITGTVLFPVPGSGGSDTRAQAALSGHGITQAPGPVNSIVPTVSPVAGTIPDQYLAMKTGAVTKSFPYVLRGEQGEITLTMYKGVAREIAKEDPYSYVGEKDRYRKFIYLPKQDPFLNPLVDAIREKSGDPDDQVRIAVSLVQQIPYDQEMLDKGTLEIRYPYQTLLDNKGVCCEKSVLLAYILHKLGYGVALFDFEHEKHTVVGIKTAPEYAYKNTGYAFIETTTPLIITDGNGEYPAFGRIVSQPEVLPAGEGKSFGSVNEEWNDAREWERLNSLGPVLDRPDYSRWQSLCRKYGIVPGQA